MCLVRITEATETYIEYDLDRFSDESHRDDRPVPRPRQVTRKQRFAGEMTLGERAAMAKRKAINFR